MATILTPSSNDGSLSDSTEVTIVPAPTTGKQRMTRTITIMNNDDADVTVHLILANGVNRRTIKKTTLNPGDTLLFGDEGEVVVLDTVNKSLIARLDGPISSSPVDFTSNWADKSQSS